MAKIGDIPNRKRQKKMDNKYRRNNNNNNNSNNNRKPKQKILPNMHYKKYASTLKGIDIRWSNDNNKIFPEYRDISGSFVSQKRINKIKGIIQLLLIQEENKIMKAFKTMANKFYNNDPTLKINIKMALNRVESTTAKNVCSIGSFFHLEIQYIIYLTIY